MSDRDCEKCGQPHVRPDGTPSCIGHSRGRLRPEIAGKPCRARPLKGQRVCRVHGGAASHAKAAAEERMHREQQQQLAAATLGAEPDMTKDPGEIILEQIGWRYRHVQWLRTRVQKVDPDALIWGLTKHKDGGDDAGTTYEARPNTWLSLYMEWSRDLEKLCLDAVRVGVEIRRVEMEERNADLFVAVLDALLIDLGKDPNDPATAEVVERHLRVVGG